MADVEIRLSEDEALVLLDWLGAVAVEGVAPHPADWQVLWNLESLLEARVAAVVAADYRDHVAAARLRLAGGQEPGAAQ